MRIPVTIGLVLISVLTQAQLEDFRNTNFKKADSIAGLFPKHPLTDLQSLSDKLTQSLSDPEEKFRAIYVWVCQNIENDYSLFLQFKNQSKKLQKGVKPDLTKEYRAKVFATLRSKHRTTCSGYAYLIRELASRAGLSCKIINGYGRTAHVNVGGTGTINHAWNAVLLNNKWYLCDATWSSGIIDAERHEFVKRFDDTYFLLQPEFFARNHYPEDPAWFLTDERPTLDQFLNQPIQYAATLRYQIQIKSPQWFSISAMRGELIQFQFDQNLENLGSLEVKVVESDKVRSYTPTMTFACETGWSIDHTFQSRGVRALHIFLDGHVVYSYQVTVR